MLYDTQEEALAAEGADDTSTVTMRVGAVAGGTIIAGIISAVLIDAYFYGWGCFKRCENVFFVRPAITINRIYESTR